MPHVPARCHWRHLALLAMLACVAAMAASAKVALPVPAGTEPSAPAAPPAPAARFADYGQPGVFLLLRQGQRAQTVHASHPGNAQWADVARRPASTFKVLLALIALETGALRSADEILPWNGKPTPQRPEWQRDMALREAMQTSSEPFFGALAERIGRKRLASWVAKAGYGNGRIGETPALVWHDGVLTVTPRQQLLFVDRLRRGALPFKPAHIAAVKAAMRDDTQTGVRLFAKTGTHLDDDGTGTAWWIGWVESERGGASFALMIDLKKMDNRDKRIALGKQLLRDAGVLAMP